MSYVTYQGKQIYYEEEGNGELVFLLHGNTASAHMFDELKVLYQGYHLVMMDFLGHGRSDSLCKFPIDFWFDQGQQILTLLKQFPKEKAILIGSSGGAISAINAALSDPTQIKCVIADSFVGECCSEEMLEPIKLERAQHLASEAESAFYIAMQGEKYREVVTMDTQMLIEHARTIQHYFHHPLSQLQVPTLLLGSKQDEMLLHLDVTYPIIAKKNKNIQYHVFESGGHPAMLSNAEASAELIHAFIKQHR